MNPNVSILTVNYSDEPYNTNDFVELMIRTAGDHTVVVVENSHRPRKIKGKHKLVNNRGERSHGEGLNLGLTAVETPMVLILDVDCHLLSKDWYFLFDDHYGSLKPWVPEAGCITVAGPPQKPIRPACVYMKTGLARQLDWRATPGYKGHRVTPDGFDVGILAYRQLVEWGYPVRFMETTKPSRYSTLNGEEYGIGGVPLVYHHWHGTHLAHRAHDYPGHDLLADKKRLLDHFPKIKMFT